jgi:hypothetical protein
MRIGRLNIAGLLGPMSAADARLAALRASFQTFMSQGITPASMSQHGTSGPSLPAVWGGGGRAAGGVVRRPELALIGESGPEAVIPLTRPRRAAQVMAEAGLGGQVVNRGGDVHVHIGTLMGTDSRAARQLADMVGRQIMGGVMRGMVGQNA